MPRDLCMKRIMPALVLTAMLFCISGCGDAPDSVSSSKEEVSSKMSSVTTSEASSQITYRDLQENIVSATAQNDADYYTYGKVNDGLRILFVGNSITKHAPKADIGWSNDCGMAATSIEKDYVHLLMAKTQTICPDASFALLQVAEYERGFFDMSPKDYYKEALEFDADIIIMFFGANVDQSYDTMENPPKTFGKAYDDLRTWLDPDGDAVVYHSLGWYVRDKLEEEKRAVAKKHGDTFIDISSAREQTDAYGMFNHPNDKGMSLIADCFWSYMEPSVKDYVQKSDSSSSK